MPISRIHITGASGAGTTTLGAAVGQAVDVTHVDTDNFYWQPTEPPFTIARPMPERLERLEAVLAQSERWVLSGSLMGWGDSLSPAFDLVVFLYLTPEVRLERTLARERKRYGPRIQPGGDMHEQHLAFMDWSRGYDTPGWRGRNLALHEAWLTGLSCPVLRIDGSPTPAESLARVLAVL